jgi:hypothetical protein
MMVKKTNERRVRVRVMVRVQKQVLHLRQAGYVECSIPKTRGFCGAPGLAALSFFLQEEGEKRTCSIFSDKVCCVVLCPLAWPYLALSRLALSCLLS